MLFSFPFLSMHCQTLTQQQQHHAVSSNLFKLAFKNYPTHGIEEEERDEENGQRHFQDVFNECH